MLFIALPHGVSMKKMEPSCVRKRGSSSISVPISGSTTRPIIPNWYGHEHELAAIWASSFMASPSFIARRSGRPILFRALGAWRRRRFSGLYPLYQAGVVDRRIPTTIEAKTGSSGSGGAPGLASHHPERSGVIRSFKPTGHRHSAEIIQELTFDGVKPDIAFTATSIEAVRGIVATSHVILKDPLAEKDLWQIYRAAYKDEPFMRIVKESSGIHRYPEPKILAGSNYCDVGFERDPFSNRVVVIAALDNLMKGAAGQAVQAFNIRCGYEETCGIDFAGLHPI